MLDFMNTIWYTQVIVIVIMPMNGYILATNPVLGLSLILLQIPYLLGRIKND